MKKTGLFSIFIIIFFSTFFSTVNAYSKNIAFIIDATYSLHKVLLQEKRSIKELLELLSITDPNSTITVVKFGTSKQGKVIVTTKANRIKLPHIARKIDKSFYRLYKINTDFAEGVKLALQTGKRFDYTFFITDGGDNYESSFKEIKKYTTHIQRLGKVIFIIVPNSTHKKMSAKARLRLKRWQQLLNNATVIDVSNSPILKYILLTLMKSKIEGKIAGYGNIYIPPTKTIKIKKYSNNSTLKMIFIPAIKIKDAPGYYYNGRYISYLKISGSKGIKKILFNSFGSRYVFFMENTTIKPVLQLYPHNRFYFKHQSINYYFYFTPNNEGKQIVDNRLFKHSLNVELKSSAFTIKGKLSSVEKGNFAFKKTGEKHICAKYSYFHKALNSKKCVKVSSIKVKKKAKLINIVISSKNHYSYAPIKVTAILSYPRAFKTLNLKLNNKLIKLKKVDNNIYSTVLYLKPDHYQFSSIYDNLPLSGTTSFEVKNRSFLCRVSEGHQGDTQEISVPLSSKTIEIPFSIPILSTNNLNLWESVKCSIKPLLKKEKFSFSINLPSYLKVKVNGKKNSIISFIRHASVKELKIIPSEIDKGFKLKLVAPENLEIESFITNDLDVAQFSKFTLTTEDNRSITLPNKDVVLRLSISDISRSLLYAKRAAEFVSLLIAVSVVIFIILIILAYKLRKEHKKRKMWKRILNELAPEDFYTEIPKNITGKISKEMLERFDDLDGKEKKKIYKLSKFWRLKELESFETKLREPIIRKTFTFFSNTITITAFEKGPNKARLRVAQRDINIYIKYTKDHYLLRSNIEIKVNGESIMSSLHKEIDATSKKELRIEIEGYLVIVTPIENENKLIIEARKIAS